MGRVSVGQMSAAAQRCRIVNSAPELAIRDPQASLRPPSRKAALMWWPIFPRSSKPTMPLPIASRRMLSQLAETRGERRW